MKKIICKKEYDTETATLIQKYTVGAFGDPAGLLSLVANLLTPSPRTMFWTSWMA